MLGGSGTLWSGVEKLENRNVGLHVGEEFLNWNFWYK